MSIHTVCTTGGLSLNAKLIQNLTQYTTLIIPSWPTNNNSVNSVIADEIRQFHQQGKRILTFCSGAFLLASLGILNNRKATTHWRYAKKFKASFPSVNYINDVLYIYQDTIGCSAGSSAAIDLSLEVIRHDFGFETANKVARRLVISAHRKGGQAQFIETPIQAQSSQLTNTLDWAIQHLNSSITVQDLANNANMSRRTFDRKFRKTLNTTPKEWLITQQLNLAQQLLETTDLRIEQVAEQSGFNNAISMRHHFRKQLSISPRQYSEQFSSAKKNRTSSQLIL